LPASKRRRRRSQEKNKKFRTRTIERKGALCLLVISSRVVSVNKCRPKESDENKNKNIY
jgi:hypothetical protein